MKRDRLDVRDKMPSGMEEYLAQNGWHFNKRLCEWAISLLKQKSGDGKEEPIQTISKEEVQQMFKNAAIKVENCVGYDVVYVYHLMKCKYYGTSILGEQKLLLHIKTYLDDCNGYDGLPLTRFYADCIGLGIPIMWEDML